MKPVDVRRARAWMKQHSQQFDDAQQLSDAVCDVYSLYEADVIVPKEVLDMAIEIMASR